MCVCVCVTSVLHYTSKLALVYTFTYVCCVGAGKTTLATKLAEKMDLPCFYEPVIDNVYLADFYRDPSRYSFPLQVGAEVKAYYAITSSVVVCAGVPAESSLPAAPTDHLAGEGRSAGQDHLRGLCVCKGVCASLQKL